MPNQVLLTFLQVGIGFTCSETFSALFDHFKQEKVSESKSH